MKVSGTQSPPESPPLAPLSPPTGLPLIDVSSLPSASIPLNLGRSTALRFMLPMKNGSTNKVDDKVVDNAAVEPQKLEEMLKMRPSALYPEIKELLKNG